MTRIPHAAGGRGKKRPAIVVQADRYNQSERHLIVVEITSNLSRASDPANLLIEVSTPEGQATALGTRFRRHLLATGDNQRATC
jgi:mRNA-degrading endonuclease toxin of MazEF toxin-antitoxin module